MMDLKEIIKWFIPCFHLLLKRINKMNVLLTFCVVLLFSCPSSSEAKVSRHTAAGASDAKNVNSFNENQINRTNIEVAREVGDAAVGRTFGRPFKKMIQAFIPIAFQLGAASTWAVVAAIVGVKTLLVALTILKIMLLAGAAKFGALFASKVHSSEHQSWTPQKEIHLHIHNGGYHGDDHSVPIVSPWSREGVVQPNPAENKQVNVIYDPYAAGPQTISTPYGHYMKIDPAHPVTQ